MKNKILSPGNLGVLFIILSMLLSGCGQKNQKPAPQQQSLQTEQQENKVPDQLTGIENNIESLIKALNGPAIEMKDEKQKKGMQESGKEQQQGQDEKDKGGSDKSDKKEEGQDKEGDKSKEGGGGEDKQEQGGGGQEQKAKQPQPTPKPEDPWEKITPILNNMHYQWNDYTPMAQKEGASKTLLESFSGALNSLTNNVILKNKTATLLSASYLYSFIPDFYSLYKTPTSPEIKKIRYYTRDAMLNAMTSNWNQSESDISNLKSSWSFYKNLVPKEQQEKGTKLDMSIMELEKVVKAKDTALVDIKGRVAISNIQSLEKAIEESAKKQSSQSQGQSSGGGQGGQGQSSGSGQGGQGQSSGGGQGNQGS